MKRYVSALSLALAVTMLAGCAGLSGGSREISSQVEEADFTIEDAPMTETVIDLPVESEEVPEETQEVLPEETPAAEEPEPEPELPAEEVYSWDESWEYASFSAIHSSDVTLYRAQGENRKGIVVCVNAGHGTSGGSSVKTQCHPDGSAKVTGGSTSAGSVTAAAVSGGTSMLDGTPEASVTLSLALLCKQALLEDGYDVLMIRESDDAQLDNVARTVMANNLADCHIALHYDSTESDKGLFYTSVPDVSSYRSMEPVASHWQEHTALGEAVLSGMSSVGVKIWSSGSMAIDLTQTSYSTVPSIDLEVGDRASDYSEATQSLIAQGLAAGIDAYFFG